MKIRKVVLTIAIGIFMLFGFTACDIGNEKETQNGIAFQTLSVEENTVYGKVGNEVETFSFIDEVTVLGNSKFIVALDVYGLQQVLTKTVSLAEGDNGFYIIEFLNEEPKNVYAVNIHRRAMCEVVFNTDCGMVLPTQTVEEDSFASVPTLDMVKTGYLFTGWDYDFTTPITEDKTINAIWSPNTDTPYKVVYCLQDIYNDTLYVAQETETENLTGTTGAVVSAQVKTFEHFTHTRTDTESGTIAPDGSTVLKVLYNRNKYTVTFDGDGGVLTSGVARQEVKYGGSAIAPTFRKTGYSFDGWDKDFTNISGNITVKAEWNEVGYSITYYAVIDGGTPTGIPNEMKAQNGRYPQSYLYGIGAVVSDLADTAIYDFQGWYIDASCTTAFTSPISTTSATNQTLYAKISTGAQPPQTPNTPTSETRKITYYAIIDGGVPIAVPQALKLSAGSYPVEYTVGTGATISALQDVAQYDFIGWYVNQACDNAFNGTIDTTANGDVSLYAKVETQAKITYLAVLDGEVKAFNMDYFKEQDGNYPEKYIYNTTTTVSALKTVGGYEFGGWYLDEECTVAFNGTIDATVTSIRGELKLYAKFTDINNDSYWTPNY